MAPSRPSASRPSASSVRPLVKRRVVAERETISQEAEADGPYPEDLPVPIQTSRRITQGQRTARPALPRVAQTTLAQRGATATRASQLTPLPDPIRDPAQLKKISAILPYSDYEPDPERLKEDTCLNLCPRPGGCPTCKADPSGNGESTCPDCPEEVRLSTARLQARNFPLLSYCWEPTNLWSYPLYFEDFELERYGHTRGFLQPLWSVGRFGVQLFGLPYQMTISPMCQQRYALGYYRPGACVPAKYYQVPWNTEAAVVEAGVLTGGYFLFAP